MMGMCVFTQNVTRQHPAAAIAAAMAAGVFNFDTNRCDTNRCPETLNRLPRLPLAAYLSNRREYRPLELPCHAGEGPAKPPDQQRTGGSECSTVGDWVAAQSINAVLQEERCHEARDLGDDEEGGGGGDAPRGCLVKDSDPQEKR